jgi:hypothetical protein
MLGRILLVVTGTARCRADTNAGIEIASKLGCCPTDPQLLVNRSFLNGGLMGVDLSLDPLGNRVRDGGQRVQLAAARWWRTGAMTTDRPFPTGDQDSTVTQLVIRRSVRAPSVPLWTGPDLRAA